MLSVVFFINIVQPITSINCFQIDQHRNQSTAFPEKSWSCCKLMKDQHRLGWLFWTALCYWWLPSMKDNLLDVNRLVSISMTYCNQTATDFDGILHIMQFLQIDKCSFLQFHIGILFQILENRVICLECFEYVLGCFGCKVVEFVDAINGALKEIKLNC